MGDILQPDILDDIPMDVLVTIEQAQTSALQVREFNIESSSDYEAADGALRTLKERERSVKAAWDHLAEPHNEGIRRLREIFKPIMDKISESKRLCDQTMTGWRANQKRLAEEEQRRQREIADRERSRLEAQAAKERADAETKAAEKQRKADELAAAGKAGQAAKARAQAESLIDAAESKATVYEQTAAAVPNPIVEANVPKIAGSYGRSKPWRAKEKESAVAHPNGQRKLSGLEVLILAIAEGIATGAAWPEVQLLEVNQKVIDKRANDLKEHFNIPGFESYCPGETTVSRRR